MIIQAIILGVVQGLTELLPISSSGHLIIVPWLFNFAEMSSSFDVALHTGTLFAIALFFAKDWIKLIKGGIGNVVGKKTKEGNMFWYLVAATIPGATIGFILDKYAEDFFRDKYILIGIVLIAMGIILYLVDKYKKAETKYENMTFKQTFLIGLSQALAFIPGVSRSGITITTGRFLNIDRQGAAKFSFMLSAPIVLGATIFKFKDFALDMPFIIGVLTSFIVGLFVIKFLLEYLKKGSFKVFAVYRLIIGAIVIIAAFLK